MHAGDVNNISWISAYVDTYTIMCAHTCVESQCDSDGTPLRKNSNLAHAHSQILNRSEPTRIMKVLTCFFENKLRLEDGAFGLGICMHTMGWMDIEGGVCIACPSRASEARTISTGKERFLLPTPKSLVCKDKRVSRNNQGMTMRKLAIVSTDNTSYGSGRPV